MEANCTVQPNGVTYYIPFLIGEVIMAVFICFGNILTIIAVWTTPVLRTVPNMYVVSLAVADFIVGGFALPTQISLLFPSIDPNLSKEFCLFCILSYCVSASNSIFSICVIALDRAFYIGHPLHYHRLSTERTAKIIIACTWIVSITLNTVPIYYNQWSRCSGCSTFTVIPSDFQIYIQITTVMILSILTASCYFYIFKIARSKMDPGSQSASDRLEADIKLVKTFMLVFGLYMICWLPFITMIILGHLTSLYSKDVFVVSMILASLNSGMNFFVYAVKDKDFRRAFIKILCRRETGICSVNPETRNLSMNVLG